MLTKFLVFYFYRLSLFLWNGSHLFFQSTLPAFNANNLKSLEVFYADIFRITFIKNKQ